LCYNASVKFLVDANVGRLARWLRVAGFDTVFMNDVDDNRLVRAALSEDRVLLTRDSGILERRVAVSGRLKVILVQDEDVRVQLRQVVRSLALAGQFRPFSRCAECNEPLVRVDRSAVEDLVPSHVFKTQEQFMQCPACRRVYWRGTHWEKMRRELEEIAGGA